MFRRIPTDLHDAVSLGLTTGAEIVVQKIVKLDPDFMMIRGRLAGTQDAGRVVLIPYSQLTFVALLRDLKDSEIESVFGKNDVPIVLATPTVKAEPLPAEPAPQPAPAPPAKETTVNEPAPAVNPPKKPAEVSKSMLLAKLRDRLKDSPPTNK